MSKEKTRVRAFIFTTLERGRERKARERGEKDWKTKRLEEQEG